MNKHKNIARKIHQAMLSADNFLIVPHQNPDGDALGSASAFASYLRQIGKQYDIFCASPAPKQFNFLPHARSIENDRIVLEKKHDIIIALDSSNIDYTGAKDAIDGKDHDRKPVVINIDHHATNSKYGNLNLVIPSSSSTAEVLYNFFISSQIKITDEMATALLTGIVTDTDMFSNKGTTKSSLAIACELMKKRAEMKIIKEYLVFDKPINALKLLGVILGRLQIHSETNIAYTHYTQADLINHKIKQEEFDGVANLLNFLSEGAAALVLIEKMDGTIKASLRTTRDTCDVAAIAKLFDGGGHAKAAGFSIKETSIEKALERIFHVLEKNKTYTQ